ncbi:HlyD family efflux transporter periplasmic adaptor subunit [Deinococcus detaillensis]|uniref:HlyD family efflux transporter periplasmic adaptor subunit n=1 Tax=Deinococcus detaillensis TaxID=2592048 RepID=A0A553UU57_9DEIO|nr:HlyD family efflux transporter periplasmic adaptor subunit [Deinococcus detaillensis]TSA83734.1 HlyD family efflux transporter periplasmic adaptor subunit [Deinococcus detaillensis]
MVETYRWEQPLQGSPRILIWLLTAGAVGWSAFAKVSVYAVVKGTLTPRIQPLTVSIPNTGRVVGGKVQLWQKVRKGQVLFTLDLLAHDAQDAKLQLEVQKSAAAQAGQGIDSAQIDLQSKQQAAKSARAIFDLGGLSRADLEAAVAAERLAESNLQRAKSQLGSAQAQLSLQERNQQVKVISPVDGQIMQLSDIHVGQAVNGGQSVLSILPEGERLIFRGKAAESDRPKLRTDSRVQIAWNGYPRQKYGVTNGLLQGVAPTSDTDAANGNVTYQVEVELPLEGGRLQLAGRSLVPGMVGEAHVLSSEKTVLASFGTGCAALIRGAE